MEGASDIGFELLFELIREAGTLFTLDHTKNNLKLAQVFADRTKYEVDLANSSRHLQVLRRHWKR